METVELKAFILVRYAVLLAYLQEQLEDIKLFQVTKAPIFGQNFILKDTDGFLWTPLSPILQTGLEYFQKRNASTLKNSSLEILMPIASLFKKT